MNNIGLQEIYYGKYFSLEDRMKSIKSVTLDEINETAKQLFDLKKVHLSCVGDMSESQFAKIPVQFGF